MAPPYPTFAVANRLLDMAEESRKPIDPMKLQKLVYFAHGWHLGIIDLPLIDEMIEAWQYGPVISSLYHEFKGFGRSAIKGRAVDSEISKGEGGKLVIRESMPALEDCPGDHARTEKFLRALWARYGEFSPIQLSNMTHLEGSPWRQRVAEYGGSPPRGLDIPNELIREYFRARIRRSNSSTRSTSRQVSNRVKEPTA